MNLQARIDVAPAAKPVAEPFGPTADAPSRLASVVNLTEDAIIFIDLDGVILGWNRGAERTYGYPPQAILGGSILSLVPADLRSQMEGILFTIRRGDTVERLETVRLRRDGTPVDVCVSVTPTRDDRGQITGAISIARDITAVQDALREVERSSVKLSEREQILRRALLALRKSHEELKSAQLQLIQAAKLESIGRLAAGVAHEVKNPLAIILSGVEFLAQVVPPDDEDITSALGDMQDAVRRADSVIRGLLDFSTASELNPTSEDLNAVLEASVHLVRHALTRSHVMLVMDLEPGLPPVMLDRNKIEQVFVNLMINAVDAMPSGGTLTVRTHQRQMAATAPDVGYRATDRFRVGQTVVVAEIEDTGIGIDARCLTRLFDPFFTTKPSGKGTGLGLAVSRTIISLHGGTIQIANRDGGGARATVVFRSVRSQSEGRP